MNRNLRYLLLDTNEGSSRLMEEEAKMDSQRRLLFVTGIDRVSR